MSDFIIIDLNQTVNRAQLREQKREVGRWFLFAIYALCFIGLGFGFYSFQNDLIRLSEERKLRIEDVKNQIESLKEDEGIDLSKADIENLYEWKSNRVLWADKLNILSEITPEHMAITGVNYSTSLVRRELTKRVTVTAISRVFDDLKDFTVVENFINTLKNNELFNADFTDIKFINSERFISRGQEILKFKIELTRKKRLQKK
ncbi:MAG: hypothetical protein HN729_10470 [Candidatus Marinimicrobia bacterium]|jgi:hypothetical protein|nr:hypothetical protein [Candidatus Neomarinimicrobiota bacterium]MBT3634074.1 hypothetical protein [Candidatus Neomarinimicrobiota bacterium]MBT3683052.1 hypothetical protein [Candidatus Neomarinimicrobiota bacterium]MBT3759856.1 hypothetical protein [Candidatus Neomarinimicrobiota bacterium]MBT3895691.1 hypothetical protein [Candidatus Neomarinimicrobiota bacterium]